MSEKAAKRAFSVDLNKNNGEKKMLFMDIHNDKSKNHCVLLLYELVSILLC